MSDFWSTESIQNATSEPLTVEMLQRTWDQIVNQEWEPSPCQLGHHLVSATAKERLREGKPARCANCAVVFDIHEDRVRVLGW